MKLRRHSYTHQEQKLHAFPCRIKECRKPKTAVTQRTRTNIRRSHWNISTCFCVTP
jgi:hypothetical protein